MANVKISELPLATSPLDSAVVMPVVQGGVTKRAPVNTIGFLQSGTGATLRTSQDKMRDIVSVKDFGAVGDGITNDRAAFQAATDYCASQTWGGTVYIPPGIYNIVGTVSQSRVSDSSKGMVNYQGAGRLATTVYHSGATALFQATGNPSEIGKQYTDMKVSGMTILGLSSKVAGSVAIGHTLVSDPHYEDLHIEGFDYAWYLQDVDQAVFSACMIQFNNKGVFARQDPAGPGVTPNCTQPNQHVFTGVTFLNNSDYAFYYNGGSNLTYLGGVISGNGQVGAGGFGITIENPGYQGGAILGMFGTNFEDNNGIADVILVATLANGGLTQGTYLFSNCSFNRTSNVRRATNVILTNFASVATVGEQIVTFDTCCFKSLGGYTPSGARPYLNWSGTQTRNARNFSAPGTIFEDAVEAPTFVQNITKPFVQLSRAANQTIANVTPTIWQLDTTDTGFSWGGAINGSYQISVPDAGLYAFSTSLVFTSTPAGVLRAEVLLNGATAIASNATQNLDVISASGMYYLAAGSLLSVRITQNSGGNIDVAGSSVTRSYFSIMKLVDA